MASTATINAWAEELVRSLLSNRVNPGKSRRHYDTFSRSIRHHNYGRTNQFDVQDRLAGLEEKLQILNRDDLSDALRSRRQNLHSRSERWLPDMLDFLLRMSDDPVNKSQLVDLSKIASHELSPPLLRWAEVEADDPINRRDRMWQQPEYSDFSSDEDEVIPSSDTTSPAGVRLHEPAKIDPELKEKPFPIATIPSSTLVEKFQTNIFWADKSDRVRITEVQAVREVLFMCQGLPTALFPLQNGQITLNDKYCLDSADDNLIAAVLHDAIGAATSAAYVRGWPSRQQGSKYLEVLQDEVQRISSAFNAWISTLHQDALSATTVGGVVSLLKTIQAIERRASLIFAVERFLRDVDQVDPITHLEMLFQHLCRAEVCTSDYCKEFLAIFLATMKAYCIPLDEWIQKGDIDPIETSFFVQRQENENQKASLWSTWYTCIGSGPNRCPNFLSDHQKDVFATGKTVAFLRELSPHDTVLDNIESASGLASAIEVACKASESSLIPLAVSIDGYVREHVHRQLDIVTNQLQEILQQKCGLWKTMDALEYLFLARNGVLLDSYETKMFEQIDNAILSWNDSYLLSDLIEEVYADTKSVEPERIVVHGDTSSKKALKIRRLSVELLGDLAIEYVVPWPISNIIPSESLASYRRIALLLCQIRRAKYGLERTAYGHFQCLSDSPFAKSSHGTYFALLFFVNTLYDHFVSCVIRPMTLRMREELTGTLDQMIHVHGVYIAALEYACLISKNLKVLKDTALAILDVCVQFSLSRQTGQKVSDFRGIFKRHVVFLTAGLRGVAASGGATAESLEMLADRLDGLKVERLPGS